MGFLLPVALESGRQLGNRLFGGPEYRDARLNYDNIPTVVFAHPEVGTIGLTEPQALKKFGAENIKTYHSKMSTMRSVILTPEAKAKHPAEFKIVCQGPDESIVGLHMVGFGTSEILQGFAVAVNMGATKKDFNKCLPIHPTTAESLVRCPPTIFVCYEA
jgi:glutathione reductase (NADPH)